MKKNWILAALMMTMALAAMDVTIVSTVIPQIVADLGGFSKFSWVFSIYLLAQTVTIPVYGKLADIFGRKIILIIGTIIFLTGSVACAVSWDIYSLIIFRALQGLGAGSIMATVNTIAGDIYSIRERAKIQGWLSSIWGISAILGPALGGILTSYSNWRWIFLVNLPIGFISILLLVFFFKENVVRKRHKIDYLGALSVLLTVGLFIFYLLEIGTTWPLRSLPGLLIPLVVIVLAGVTIAIERRVAEPILPGWLLRDRSFMFTALAMVFMGITLMGAGDIPAHLCPIVARCRNHKFWISIGGNEYWLATFLGAFRACLSAHRIS